MNVADSEVVASIMGMSGYETHRIYKQKQMPSSLTPCSIRTMQNKKAFSRLDYFQSLKRKEKDIIIGVLGCMAEKLKKIYLNEKS